MLSPQVIRLRPAPHSRTPVLAAELGPFRRVAPPGPLLAAYLKGIPRRAPKTVDFLVDLNRRLAAEIGYIVRLEPGVWPAEQVLSNRRGSCRDSGWLLVNILRHLGFAARFVSGYLIQLVPDVKPVAGPAADFTDLHAWCEAYVPGAGWIGLDPTSGLLAGEGHIPLAATPEPASAAPITGGVDECETTFGFHMEVRRIADGRRRAGGQPLPAPAGPAEVAGRLLAQPPLALLPVQRPVHRSHQPASPRGRGTRRCRVRA